MAYTIAALAVETGIAPKEFIDMDEEMFRHIIQVMQDRAKGVQNAGKRNRR